MPARLEGVLCSAHEPSCVPLPLTNRAQVKHASFCVLVLDLESLDMRKPTLDGLTMRAPSKLPLQAVAAPARTGRVGTAASLNATWVQLPQYLLL